MLLEFALALLTSLLVCGRKRKKRVKVTKRYLKVGNEYVFGFKIEKLAPLAVVDRDKLSEYLRAIAGCCPNSEIEVRTVRARVTYDDVLRRLENEIMTLRVIVEADPSNVKAEMKLRYLERLMQIAKDVPPMKMFTVYLIRSRSLRDAEEGAKFLSNMIKSLFDAKVKQLSGNEILNLMRLKKELFGADASLMSFPMGKEESLYGIYVGVDDRGRAYVIPLDDLLYHVAVFGATGSGKSTLLCTISRRAKLLDLKVIAIDPKGDLLEMCGECFDEKYGPFRGDLERRRAEVKKAYEKVFDMIVRSGRRQNVEGLIVIDEAWLLGEEIPSLIREARSRGYGIIIATHSPSDLGDTVLQNAYTKIFMRLNAVDSYTKRLGVPKSVLRLQPGEALVLDPSWDIKKIRVEPEVQTVTRTTLKSSMPSSRNVLSREDGSVEGSSSTKKKLGTVLDT